MFPHYTEVNPNRNVACHAAEKMAARLVAVYTEAAASLKYHVPSPWRPVNWMDLLH